MASITTHEASGRRMIQFTGPDGARRSIRLGKLSMRQAKTLRVHIECLISAKIIGQAPADETSRWVAGLGDVLRRRLEKVGLLRPQEDHECPTLGEWLSAYILSRTDVKTNTKCLYRQTENDLLECFGASMPLAGITAGDAEGFRLFLHNKKLAEATIRRRCGRAKQFFAAGVAKEIIAHNPFEAIRCGSIANRDRMHFVSHEDISAVIAACPCVQWRLIFALARFGGLRVPSEVVLLEWTDILWDRRRFVVHSPKTAHQGKDSRIVPIFGELYPFLLDAFEQAEPGESRVITRYRSGAQNVGTQARRIIRRAGLEPWQKVFVNCRSSRETELLEQFPLQTATAWLGNSPQIAARHYLQVREQDFVKGAASAGTGGALHNPMQSVTVRGNLPVSDGPANGDICEQNRENGPFCENGTPPRPPRLGLEPRT